MKHIFTLLLSLVFFSGLFIRAQAQSDIRRKKNNLDIPTDFKSTSTPIKTAPNGPVKGQLASSPDLPAPAIKSTRVIIASPTPGTNALAVTQETFPFSGSIVTYTVPAGVTSLTVEARGAEGGNANSSSLRPGKGAIITGVLSVSPGQQLRILVGQQPFTTTGNGGGGGSFVTSITNQPLIIAGGGGGSGNTNDSASKNGQSGNDGGAGSGGGGLGGTMGKGGKSVGTGTYVTAAGGGLLTDGANDPFVSGTGGKAFVNGGAGGTISETGRGGFGGGGAGSDAIAGGGGGGYSGGGNTNGDGGVGGGGGSYNAGTSPVNTAGANSGNGLVIISYNTCQPFTAGLTNDGPLTCAKTSVKLTATGGLDGATYAFSRSVQTSGPTSATATATNDGPYSVTVTNPGGCSATATTTVMSTTAPPMVSITPSAATICAGQTTTLTASGANTYRWNTGATTAAISVSAMGPYSVTGTSTSTGCSNTATANVTVTPLPNAMFTGLSTSVCVDAAPLSLSPATSGGTFSGPGINGNTFSPASAGAGGPYSITYTVSNQGCPNSSVQQVTVNPLPMAPTIATQSGHSYPGGVSSLTISQNTGNVVLMTSGCMGGTITWAGGSSNTLAVSTMNTGVQTFTATCTSNSTGCTSPKATATVTVVGTTLSVLHRDATNGQINTNTLNPYLELQNNGNTAIPYSEITVRYFLTVENFSPLQFQINYAQLGSDKVHLKYVPAATGNPTATGYIEFSFDASAGSLGAGQNSGPIQDIINKQDFSNFDQSNDYSYVNVGQYTPNPRITAYRNGTIFYGMEPGPVTPMQSVKATLQNNTGADANSIEAVLSVTNDGNVPINYGDIKVRYYFTADNAQPLVLNQVGYTALGSGNVSAQIMTISPALAGADRYLELSFSPGLGQLAPGASTGGVTYQIRHADYSGFNQNNDYSYQGTGGTMVNPHVVVFVAGVRAYGTEPGTGGRLSAEEAETPLRVQVLGNPVRGSAVEVVVSGAEGQALTLHLTDITGRSVTTRQIERAGATESQRLEVGSASGGMLLLRVSTPTQSQTVKILRQ